MARPIDPDLRAARRLQIIDAGLTAFAEHGASATTAQICAVAGIGSGTFFHHFPTKDSLVLAILELGTAEMREFLDGLVTEPSARAAIHDVVDHAVEDLTDPRAAGFILAVGAMTSRPDVVAALAADDQAVRRGVASLLERAEPADRIRTDIPASRLAQWVLMLSDAVAEGVANGQMHAADEIGVLHEQVDALLDGPGR